MQSSKKSWNFSIEPKTMLRIFGKINSAWMRVARAWMQRRGNEISFGVWQRSHQSLGYRGRSMANAAYATGITISYRGPQPQYCNILQYTAIYCNILHYCNTAILQYPIEAQLQYFNVAYATGITISYRGCSATILFWIKSIYELAVDLQNPNLSGQQNHQSHNDLP